MPFVHVDDVVQVSHDAFARVSTIRQCVKHQCECAWCGQPAKFKYGGWPDGYGASPFINDETFCSIGCYRLYHS